MTPLSILTAIAPDLAVLANASDVLSLCELRVNKKNWGKVRPQAVAYLAAHTLKITQPGFRSTLGASGPVTSATEGGLSLSFGSSGSDSDGALGSTSYGQEYLRLLKETIPAIG